MIELRTQKCPRCGKELPDHVNICTKCGKVFGIDRPRREGTVRGKGCMWFLGAGGAGLSGLLYCMDQLV